MTRMRDDQRGFTLIELLVTLMIIGVLAAIALPAMISQRAKAQDTNAKSDARNMVSQIESCFTEQDRYDGCPNMVTGLDIGTSRGQVQAVPGGDTYVVTAYSKSGNTFSIARASDGVARRTCDGTASPSGGCVGGKW